MSLDPPLPDAEILRKLAERQGRIPERPFDNLGPGYVGVDLRGTASTPKRKRASKARSIPTEHEEQRKLFGWIDETQRLVAPVFGYIYAIPNGGYRTPAAAGKAKAEGQRPGYPDIAWDLPCGSYTGFRGELKRVGKGQLSPLQAEWHHWLKRCGLYVCVASGWEAMRDELLLYHSLTPITATEA